MKKLEDYIVSIPDFPRPGILFRDVTGVLDSGEGLRLAVEALAGCLDGLEFDAIAGVESRGFLFGAPLAYRLGKGFIPVRKPGKLPRAVVRQSYDLEYGSATVEMHADAVKPGQCVVVMDDLLATGGTAVGIAEALNREVVVIDGKEYKVKVKEFLFIVEFPDLYDHQLINSIAPVHSFLKIEGE